MLIRLFLTFFKIGAFTLGGGYAMLEMVERDVVTRRQWLDKTTFWDLITVVQSLPGVFAVNTALYVGYKLRGRFGAVVATLGAVLPSMIIILMIAIFFTDYKDNPVVQRVFCGIRPCVVALILSPAIKMMKQAKITWLTILIPLGVAFSVWFWHVSPVWIIFSAIIICVAYAFFITHKKVTR